MHMLLFHNIFKVKAWSTLVGGIALQAKMAKKNADKSYG